MEKNTFTIDPIKKTVTLCHITDTLDGKMQFETTFDMSNVKLERMLKRMADAEVISWRARSGVKELTAKEIEEKGLFKTTVDCSKTVSKAKHIETAEEKELKKLVADAMKSGGDLKTIMAKVKEALAKNEPEAETETETETEDEGSN